MDDALNSKFVCLHFKYCGIALPRFVRTLKNKCVARWRCLCLPPPMFLQTLVTALSSWFNSYIHHTVLTSFLSTWYELWRNPWFLSTSTIGWYWKSLFCYENRQHGNFTLKPTSMAFISPDWSTMAMSKPPGLVGTFPQNYEGGDAQVGKAMKTSMDPMAKLPRFGWFVCKQILWNKQTQSNWYRCRSQGVFLLTLAVP